MNLSKDLVPIISKKDMDIEAVSVKLCSQFPSGFEMV
jgi:hypothetical protein